MTLICRGKIDLRKTLINVYIIYKVIIAINDKRYNNVIVKRIGEKKEKVLMLLQTRSKLGLNMTGQ